ncbi:stromal processing peptidase, chloroplastic-like isoform X3 [Glycine soja]|uniref:stromal processing peptidase, chloroplastic-like isoform X3 n=1 Tax=Glycine soja TaxID=3848 RepID=UPI00103990D9|nr:stromal processing peptidase, chloroplastic-like isoform X3 [Glycine soja]
MGLKAIFDGKLAVLLLSGGQVHRTKWTGDASSSPKLPSKLHKNTTIVACVPKKVHIEGAGETGFKISSIEITDAIKAGLDEPIQPEPEKRCMKINRTRRKWLTQ